MLSTRVHQDAMPGFQSELDKKVSASSFRSPLSREQEMGVDALYDTVEADMEVSRYLGAALFACPARPQY